MSDPFGETGASQSSRPVASRKWLMEILLDAGVPLDFDELCCLTETTKDNCEGLRNLLNVMCSDGQIVMDRIGRFNLVDRAGLLSGKVIAHRDGYGFLQPDNDGERLYLHDRQMKKVYHGDRVLVAKKRPTRNSRNKSEARIVEVLERGSSRIIGRLNKQAGVIFVIPQDERFHHQILIPDDKVNGARLGEFVVAEIDFFPESNRQPIGHVADIVGGTSDPGIEVQVAIRTHDLPYKFSKSAIAQAAFCGDTVNSEQFLHRLDLRELPFVTIDGADAKDLDDAVYALPRGESGWTLWVAVADVAHYVPEHSVLDREAIERGTSVYFPSEVIPMLPESLSNGLCSLNPNLDRLALAVCVEISATGQVLKYRFNEVLIKSHQRLTYNQVQEAMDSVGERRLNSKDLVLALDKAGHFQTKQITENIVSLFSVYEVLRAARENRGALDFNSVEPYFAFDEHGKIASVMARERLDAQKIIEECMLVANVSAALSLKRFKLSAVYRIHESPTSERLEALRHFLSSMGFAMGGGEKPAPSDYQSVIYQAHSRPDFPLIQAMILRSMQQARYAPDADVGHFGLAYDSYTHFTSPIRRYPDLAVHRLLKRIIQTGAQDKASKMVRDGLPDLQQAINLGEHCSMTERRADEASRDVAQWLKCQFMSKKLGEVYQGTVTGVAGFGLFILLDTLFVEGMVHVTQLPPDYWIFNDHQHSLTGERTHQVFRLADSVRVKIVRVDLESRRIDFSLADNSVKSLSKKNKPKFKTKSSHISAENRVKFKKSFEKSEKKRQ